MSADHKGITVVCKHCGKSFGQHFEFATTPVARCADLKTGYEQKRDPAGRSVYAGQGSAPDDKSGGDES